MRILVLIFAIANYCPVTRAITTVQLLGSGLLSIYTWAMRITAQLPVPGLLSIYRGRVTTQLPEPVIQNELYYRITCLKLQHRSAISSLKAQGLGHYQR